MLYLLDKDAKTVKWNGIPLHEVSSAIVKEETNGDFYLTVHYPITDSGVYQLIKEDMLIKTPTPVLGPQLFRIKKPVENDDSLDITAYHVSDDIMKRSIRPVSVVGQGCAMALSQMVQNAKTGLGDFSFTSDIMDSRTFNMTEIETLYSVLLDGKHSIVGTWEGELVRDNFALTIKSNRGADRGVVITTHKNLKSYQRTKNSQSVVTRIHARSTFRAEGAETDTVLTVTVDSPLIGNYPYINEKDYENNNAKTTEELRKWAEAKFTNESIDKVSDAIEIEAYELDGQVVHLGDTVNIKSRKHDVDIYKKAIAYEFNALTEEYISITFDDKPGVGGSGVSSGLSNAADVILSANRNAQEVAIERAVRNANKAFDAEFYKRVEVINDGIEQAKAEAELYADNVKQSIDADINAVNQSMQAQADEHNRQVADILSNAQSIETLANQAKTDAANAIATLHNVTETVDSHTRTIGAVGTTGSILDNVSKVTQMANGLVTEVSGANGLKTQVSTLAGSYAIQNLTNSGTVLNQLNLNKDGSIKIDGSLVQITGTTYIQDGVISSAKIGDLDAGKIKTGTLDATRIATSSITGSHIAFDQAFFNSFMANEAYLKQIFAKNAFITSVQAVTLSASQISSGIIKATNGAMVINLDSALTEYKERATIRFHSAGNVLYREKMHPLGHNTIGALMFKDSNGGGIMTALGNTSHQTIDTMRNNYGEGGLTGSFAGVRVVRDSADTNRDRVDIIADRIIMAHSTNFQEPANRGFYFYPTAVNGWWNLGRVLQLISNKFRDNGWGAIGDIYNLNHTAETSPTQYT